MDSNSSKRILVTKSVGLVRLSSERMKKETPTNKRTTNIEIKIVDGVEWYFINPQ